MNEAYDNLQFLVKYAPKYYFKADYDIADLSKSKVMLKTRTAKIIRAATIQSYSHEKKGVLMKALKSKRKYIQQIEGIKQDAMRSFPFIEKVVLCVQDYSSWRTLLQLIHLKSLTLESYNLSGGAQLFTDKKVIRYMNWRFWVHFAKFTELKHVYCHFYNQIDSLLENFLMKLTKLEPLLSSLSTLMLHFNYIEDPVVSEKANLTQLYKYTKSLKIHECSSRTLRYFLGNLEQFQSLKELSLLKAVEETHRDDYMDLQFLSNLQRLNQLEALEISFNFSLTKNLLNFLEYFALPASIVNIKLNFHEVGLKKLLNYEGLETPQITAFEKSTSYMKFCKSWKNLKNLNSLSLSFIEVENESPLYELYFVTSILKELSTLSSLYYARWCDSESENKEAVEFSHLWNSIAHLKESLKMVYLETSAISLKDFSLENENNNALNSNLKVLGLCGKVMGESDIQNLIKLLDRRDSKSTTAQLEIESLMIDSKESFEVFLRGLSRIPRDMILTINTNVSQICGKDFVNTLSKLASKIPKRRQIKLSFCNIPNVKESFLRRLLGVFEKCNVLHYIKISDQRGRVLYAGTNWFENFIQETSFFTIQNHGDKLNQENGENNNGTSNNPLEYFISECSDDNNIDY